MLIEELMTKEIRTCHANDPMNRAAQIMWDLDCGAVPVVGDDGRVVGMITDRDICMAAYTQGKPLAEIPVWVGASRDVFAVQPFDSVHTAEQLMQEKRIRRVPVVDDAGKPSGVVSLADIARRARAPREKPNGLSTETIASTLYAVSLPTHAH